ncbi:MAG: lipase [Moraxellaceae bacterium]|nr:MAG: lipase [Moraxellaceae bacterium]
MLDNDPYLLRLCYAIGFYFVYRLLDIVVLVIFLVQFVHKLVAGEPHQELAKFGQNLGLYIGAIIGYLSWSNNEKPFPFSDWPSAVADELE